MRCPICDAENPIWPVVDITTGWTFCGSCHFEVVKVFPREPSDRFGAWLRTIAKVRETISVTPQDANHAVLVQLAKGELTVDEADALIV